MHTMAEFASKGVAGSGLGLGIAGTALGLLNGLGGMAGLAANAAGCNSCGGCCSENTPVSRYEMNQAQTIAAKDAEIGLLKADKYTDQKLSEVTAYLMGQIKDLSNEVRANKDEQAGVNMQQAVYNATNTAAISCLQNQVAALQGLTKLVIPNSSVCPGWGAVKVTPETAAAATA
ncbi:MAG: hypothetical protein K2P22_04745 [Lachnospiraceae bacterium]|nr:hypothetical protein [Lachnospiraceae bacterium]